MSNNTPKNNTTNNNHTDTTTEQQHPNTLPEEHPHEPLRDIPEDENPEDNPDLQNQLTDETTEDEVDDIDGSLEKKIYTKEYDLHKIRFPTTERLVEGVEPPTICELSDTEFWLPEGKPNCTIIKEHLRKEGKISIPQIVTLIEEVYEIFCGEENIMEVDAPVTVCGDVHGQYYDLLKLLEVGGDPATTNYLFLGDYVDRGLFSMECIILLFCYKLSYPNTFFMLRGNHECRHLTDYFTFREECEYKYSRDIYDSLMDCFDALPLAAIMNKQFFCVHGGLSPELNNIDEIQQVDRFCEPPQSGLMCDLLWSDPMETFTGEIDTPFDYNTVRGCSYNFSYNVVCDFLDKNGLLSVIRAHEAQDAGYKMHRRNDRTGFPSLITLFSAPNYLDSYNNKGALMRYENNVINIRQFNASPHPYNLPGFMNVFNWSLPFVSDKVAEMLTVILSLVDDVQADREAEEVDKKLQEKRAVLRSKVLSVGRVLNLYKAMRTKIENKNKENSISPNKPAEDNTVNEPRPPGILQTIEASKAHRTPDQFRRRASRDKILLNKHHKSTERFGTKMTGTKDFQQTHNESTSPKKEPARRLPSVGEIGSVSTESFPSIQTTDIDPLHDKGSKKS